MRPWLTLAAIAFAAGVLSMWVFRRGGRSHAIRQAANRIQAYLMEFWLYVDEPALIWKSWRGLLGANARLLVLMLPPIALLAVPSMALFYYLDACYGHRPLAPGAAALVTVQLKSPASVAELQTPEGIAVEGAAVRVFALRQVSWRIRPHAAVSGTLRLLVEGATFDKSIAAGSGIRHLSVRRVRPGLDLLRYPTEAPLPGGPVEWIEVSYSATDEGIWYGWLAAFFVLGTITKQPSRQFPSLYR